MNNIFLGQNRQITLVLIGGMSVLFLSMGIARFAFTPLLPLMQIEYRFSDDISGSLASINLIGYMVGAFIIRYFKDTKHSYKIFILSIPLSILFIILMYYNNITNWYFVRFLSGVLSAILLIKSSEYIINFLMKFNKVYLSGIIFSGIGIGMVFSGITIPILFRYFSTSKIWVFLGVLSIIPGFIAATYIPKPNQEMYYNNMLKSVSCVKFEIKKYLLYVAYGLEGFGYIIIGTFISVITFRITSSVELSSYIWIVAGFSAMILTPIWSLISHYIGNRVTLIILYLIQAGTVFLLYLIPNEVSTFITAVGFGGTFLGIVTLTFVYSKEFDSSTQNIAILTLSFSIGQFIGPYVAGLLAEINGNFNLPIILAAVTIFIGSILVYFTKGGKTNACN